MNDDRAGKRGTTIRSLAMACAVLILVLGWDAVRCAKREPGTVRLFGYCVGPRAQGGN